MTELELEVLQTNLSSATKLIAELSSDIVRHARRIDTNTDRNAVLNKKITELEAKVAMNEKRIEASIVSIEAKTNRMNDHGRAITILQAEVGTVCDDDTPI